MMCVCSSRPLELHFPPFMGLISARRSTSGGSKWRLQISCKVLVKSHVHFAKHFLNTANHWHHTKISTVANKYVDTNVSLWSSRGLPNKNCKNNEQHVDKTCWSNDVNILKRTSQHLMYLPVDFVWEIITSCLSVSNRQLTTSKSVKYKSYDFHNTMQIITRCLLHNILSLIAYTFPVNRDFVFIIIVQFVMSAHIRMRLGLLIVFVLHYTISLSSLCKLIWGHWTYIVSVRYFFVKCVSKIKYIFLSYPSYNLRGYVFLVYPFPLERWREYTLSYYYHQIGSMN